MKRTVNQFDRPFDSANAGAFGTIVWNALKDHHDQYGAVATIENIADQAGLDYSHVHGIIKGKKGGPVKPSSATAAKLIEAIEVFNIRIDVEAAMKAIDNVPNGYKLVREEPADYDASREVAFQPIKEELRMAAHDGSLSKEDVEIITDLLRLRRAQRQRRTE